MLAFYGPHEGVKRGRLIGCAAIPVFVADEPTLVTRISAPAAP